VDEQPARHLDITGARLLLLGQIPQSQRLGSFFFENVELLGGGKDVCSPGERQDLPKGSVHVDGRRGKRVNRKLHHVHRYPAAHI